MQVLMIKKEYGIMEEMEEDLNLGRIALCSARTVSEELIEKFVKTSSFSECSIMSSPNTKFCKKRDNNLAEIFDKRNKLINEAQLFIKMFEENYQQCKESEALLNEMSLFAEIFLLILTAPGLVWTTKSSGTKIFLCLSLNIILTFLLVSRWNKDNKCSSETQELFENQILVLKEHPFQDTMNITLSHLEEDILCYNQDMWISYSDIMNVLISFLKLFY